MLGDLREAGGLFGGILIALAVSLRPEHATSSFVFWLGVALLAVSGIAYVLSIIGRLGARSAGIAYALHLDEVGVGLNRHDGYADVQVTIDLHNTSPGTVEYEIRDFSLVIDETRSQTEFHTQGAHVGPGLTSHFRFPGVLNLHDNPPYKGELSYLLAYWHPGKHRHEHRSSSCVGFDVILGEDAKLHISWRYLEPDKQQTVRVRGLLR